jgi:hypothetical protein
LDEALETACTTKSVYFVRREYIVTICPFCEQVEENEWHYFFGCTTTEEVWQDTEAWHIVSKYVENATEFVAMIFNMLEEIDEDNMAKIAICFSGHYGGEEIKDVGMTKYQQFLCYKTY